MTQQQQVRLGVVGVHVFHDAGRERCNGIGSRFAVVVGLHPAHTAEPADITHCTHRQSVEAEVREVDVVGGARMGFQELGSQRRIGFCMGEVSNERDA